MPDRLVYSTDAGRVTTCSVCGQLYEQCRCDQPAPPLMQKNDGIVRVMRDRKHRGGKTVTVTKGLPFRLESNAASTSTTGKSGKLSCEPLSSFLGTGMVPKSQVRQTLVTRPGWKAEPLMLNSQQTYDSRWAIVRGKAQRGLVCCIFLRG